MKIIIFFVANWSLWGLIACGEDPWSSQKERNLEDQMVGLWVRKDEINSQSVVISGITLHEDRTYRSAYRYYQELESIGAGEWFVADGKLVRKGSHRSTWVGLDWSYPGLVDSFGHEISRPSFHLSS